MGCKRVLLSDDFYPALSQPHVSLITAPIARETTRGLATTDGAEHAADVIVYATGFDVLGSVAARLPSQILFQVSFPESFNKLRYVRPNRQKIR